MTTREAFLAEIVAHPEDDGPRLVYADWLEENGETDRSEFIRLQVEMAKSQLKPGFNADMIRRKTYVQRASFEGLPSMEGDFVWLRGFVEEVRCTLACWMEHGPALVRSQPITSVRLWDRDPLQMNGRLVRLEGSAVSFRWLYDDVQPLCDEIVRTTPIEIISSLRPSIINGEFPTAAAAREALGKAALAWARSA